MVDSQIAGLVGDYSNEDVDMNDVAFLIGQGLGKDVAVEKGKTILKWADMNKEPTSRNIIGEFS